MGAEKTVKKDDLKLIVRIFSTDISGKKSLGMGLCQIRGISKMFSNAVLKIAKLPANKKIGELTEEDVKRLEEIIKTPGSYGVPSYLLNRKQDPETNKDMHIVGSELKLQNDFDIRRMKRIRSYKGLRHGWNLKVRGQRLKHFRKGGAAIAKKKQVLK